MKSPLTWRWLTAGCGLLALTGASCPRQPASSVLAPPILFQQPPSLADILQAVQGNTQRVQRLQATDATLRIPGAPALQASLALERPRRFRLRAGLGLTGNELDLGSNDNLFWMWARRQEPPALYYGEHGCCMQPDVAQLLPLPPSWLIEALGLVELDPQVAWQGPYPRAAGRVEIHGAVSWGDQHGTRVLVVDDRRGLVLEQHIYDPSGRLLAAAICHDHDYDPLQQVSLPRRIDIQLPTTGLALTLEIRQYAVNQPVGDPLQLWSLPQIPGAPLVPVCR